INSLQQIGSNASTGGGGSLGINNFGLQPDDILGRGMSITLELFSSAKDVGFFRGSIAVALIMVFARIMVLICYVCIVLQFIMAKVESYIVISAGFIYLGFGGMRCTSSYVERFLGTAVGVGIRLMVLYLMVGLGDKLATAWMQEAKFASSSSTAFSAAVPA